MILISFLIRFERSWTNLLIIDILPPSYGVPSSVKKVSLDNDLSRDLALLNSIIPRIRILIITDYYQSLNTLQRIMYCFIFAVCVLHPYSYSYSCSCSCSYSGIKSKYVRRELKITGFNSFLPSRNHTYAKGPFFQTLCVRLSMYTHLCKSYHLNGPIAQMVFDSLRTPSSYRVVRPKWHHCN